MASEYLPGLAAPLLAPYLAWVAVAAVLNVAICRLNRLAVHGKP